MNSLDSVRSEVFRLVKARRNTAFIRTRQLSKLFNVSEKEIRKDLMELAQQGSIRLFGCNGHEMRSYELWPNADEFIESGVEGGYLRIEI
jgi:hypothetical protein